MKKLICCVLLIVLLCSAAAQAEVPSLSESLFKYAKATLTCLASGDYQKIVTSLPFSDIAPGTDEWSNFATGSFSSLTGSDPQTKYAVAYWTGSAWKVAVPVSEPDSSGVETLILISADGKTCNGYACSSWGSVESEYLSSSYVSWNKEYISTTSVVIEMDVE